MLSMSLEFDFLLTWKISILIEDKIDKPALVTNILQHFVIHSNTVAYVNRLFQPGFEWNYEIKNLFWS